MKVTTLMTTTKTMSIAQQRLASKLNAMWEREMYALSLPITWRGPSAKRARRQAWRAKWGR